MLEVWKKWLPNHVWWYPNDLKHAIAAIDGGYFSDGDVELVCMGDRLGLRSPQQQMYIFNDIPNCLWCWAKLFS